MNRDNDVGVIRHGFVFAIGDTVTHAGWTGSFAMFRQMLVVIEQHMSICPGGIQRMYHLRAIWGGTLSTAPTIKALNKEMAPFLSDPIRFVHEEELIPVKPEDIEENSDV